MSVSQNRTVTLKQLKSCLLKCIEMKRPAFVHGSPGIGKSDIIRSIAQDMGGIVYDVRLSQCEPTDIRGIPYFNKDTGKMDWAPPIDLPDADTCAQYPISFLFLDEMNSAPPSVAAAAYQLVLDRRIGKYELPDNCVIVAAGNLNSDKGVTYRMPTPLANRFVHFEVRVDFDSWNEWAILNKIHPDVVGFLNFSKNSLMDFDPKSSNYSFATPRSWEFVSQLLDDNMDEELQTNIIAGAIGEGLALKLIAHRRVAADLPSTDSIFDGSVKELKNKDVALTYSLATSLTYGIKEMYDNVFKKDQGKFNRASDNMIIFMMKNFSPEITVVAMRNILQQLKIPLQVKELTCFEEFKAKFGTLLVRSSKV